MPKGLPCPSCGGDSEVIDSRRGSFAGEPSVRRRRQCVSCGTRWTTHETVSDLSQRFITVCSGIDAAMAVLKNTRETMR